MNQQRTSPTLILLAIIGLITYFSINVFTNTATEVEIDLRPILSKEAAVQSAIQYLQTHREIKEPTNTLSTFVTYRTLKEFSGYLNKNNLHDNYMESYPDLYPLDYYQVEISSEVTAFQYFVDVHMKTGEIIGWEEVTAPANPTQAPIKDAETIAETYIHNNDIDYSDVKLSPSITNDNLLIFESSAHRIGESILQLHVTVIHNKVTSFHSLFIVPESYKQWVTEQDSSTAAMSLFSIILSVLMTITAIVLSIIYRKEISFTRGLLLTLVYIIFSTVHNINMFPAFKVMFAGEAESTAMSIYYIIINLIITFVMGAAVYLSLISGDALWRKEGRYLWSRWNDTDYAHQLLRAMVKGYLFCLIILGFQSTIFFVGEQFFDVWSVNDPLFSSYNLMFPLLFPLLAVVAAISEEAIYRMFGIIIFKKIVKNTFLAVLISSMIWALGHTQYPIYPAYTRFVEVTLLGLIFGYIYLKHGFITAVFTHTCVNIVMMGLSLMLIPGGAFHSLMGVFYIASPALVAYLISLLHPWTRKARPEVL